MGLHRWFLVTIRQHPYKSGGIDIVEENMLIFSISHVTSCDYVIRFMWLYYWLHLTICQHSSKCGGYTSSEGRNIWFLVCHMTSCNQLVRRTYDFLSYFTSPCVTNLPSFVSKDLDKEDILRF